MMSQPETTPTAVHSNAAVAIRILLCLWVFLAEVSEVCVVQPASVYVQACIATSSPNNWQVTD